MSYLFLWLTGLCLGADMLHALETQQIGFISLQDIGTAFALERMQKAPGWVQALPLTPPFMLLALLFWLAGRLPRQTKRTRSRR
jgi:hypothetical protein